MISVIVPVYNVEKYLSQSVDSILNQTYSNFEVILVDDGSKDRSPEICDKYAQADSRVLVVHKENGGQNSAIKAGIKHAKGEYLFFVDSDDWLEQNALEILYSLIKEYDADLSVANAFRERDCTYAFPLHNCEEGVYDRQKIEVMIFPDLLIRMTSSKFCIAPSRCGRLFKKELVLRVLDYCDEEIRLGEDKLLTFPYIMLCQKIAFTNACLYHYRDNTASISYAFCAERIAEQRKLISILEKAVKELSTFDFSQQLEAMTVEAVGLTISGFRGQVLNKKLKEMFLCAVKDETISKKIHPFPKTILEHIKYHLIMKRQGYILWLYINVLSFFRRK